MSNFNIWQEETDNIYLAEEEINRIYKLNISSENELERIRNIFVPGCYTGLRYSDLSSIKPANIKGEFIYLRQGKTMNNVIIPLN